MAQDFCEAGILRPLPKGENAFQCGEQTVPHAPENEGPACPVPEAAEEKDDQFIQTFAQSSAASAAQGDVQVIPKPGGKGYVSSAPEIRNADSNIGILKIL